VIHFVLTEFMVGWYKATAVIDQARKD